MTPSCRLTNEFFFPALFSPQEMTQTNITFKTRRQICRRPKFVSSEDVQKIKARSVLFRLFFSYFRSNFKAEWLPVLAVAAQRAQALLDKVHPWDWATEAVSQTSFSASPAAWGTRYSRYFSHSCYLKKQMQEACGGSVAACRAQLADWGSFLLSLWFILLIFKYRNWPNGQIWVFGAVLELLTLHFLSVCQQPEGFFYSKSDLS